MTPRPLPSLLLLQLRQCMTDLADMSSEQIHWEYGYPALRMADALRNRSRDMLQHGALQGHVWCDFVWEVVRWGRTCVRGPVGSLVWEQLCEKSCVKDSSLRQKTGSAYWGYQSA